MLIKRTERQAHRGVLAHALPHQSDAGFDRRSFLRRSGLAVGGLAALGTLPLGSVRKAEAGPPAKPGAAVTIRKNICTHCSVGCTVMAEVSEGVWIGQEPGWESPINRGSHCAKGAAVRELANVVGNEVCVLLRASVDEDVAVVSGDQDGRDAAGADEIGVGVNPNRRRGLFPVRRILADAREGRTRALDWRSCLLDPRRCLPEGNRDILAGEGQRDNSNASEHSSPRSHRWLSRWRTQARP